MVEIINYSPELREHFTSLNIEWISTYFVVEPHDREQLKIRKNIFYRKAVKFILRNMKIKLLGQSH